MEDTDEIGVFVAETVIFDLEDGRYIPLIQFGILGDPNQGQLAHEVVTTVKEALAACKEALDNIADIARDEGLILDSDAFDKTETFEPVVFRASDHPETAARLKEEMGE